MEDTKQTTWTPERIQELIDKKIEEGPQLDYKAAAALSRHESKKIEVTKDISAFANSAGGTVIYGLKEFSDDARKHLPEKIDPVDGKEFSREWLDQIIGQISPRIRDVLITPVRVGPEVTQTCYVVEIPQGHTAHQARDLKYYRRYNFESVPMADYEIRDVMNRREHPNLEFSIRLTNTTNGEIRIRAKIWNKGLVLARHFKLRVLVPTVIGKAKLWKKDLPVQEVDGYKFYRISLPGFFVGPIFPSYDVIYDHEIPAVPENVPLPAADFLLCTLYADEMQPLNRKVPVAAALFDWA
jgi:hypothetical protein